MGDGGRMGFDSIGRLFDCGVDGNVVDLDFGDLDFKSVDVGTHRDRNEKSKCTDPWLYSTESNEASSQIFDGVHPTSHAKSKRTYGELALNPRLTHSHILQSTVRSYNNIVQQCLLISITFRTVDDYLEKLQASCNALNTCGSLGLVYLAAAVSDFYIPLEKRAVHKIQSRDYGLDSSETSNTNHVGADNTLTITLYPVPKVIPTLRKEWCPNAFVISFKLETDSSILRQKATMAMERNGVHLVIGNELKTRYEKVFILSRSKTSTIINESSNETLASNSESVSNKNEEYNLTEVTSADSNTKQSNSKVDTLEDATVEHVVRHHFYYISTYLDVTQPNMSSGELFLQTTSEAEQKHQARLKASYRNLQRDKLKSRLIELAWNVAGSAVGIAISYGIGKMLQQRQRIS